MTERLAAYRAAPRERQAAAVVSASQAAFFLIVALISLFRQGFPSSSASSGFRLPSLAVGALLFGLLFALPTTATLSRYPRRRHREALLFQSALVALFGAGAIFGRSISSAVYAGSAVIVIVLLNAASARRFVVQREQKFKAVSGR